MEIDAIYRNTVIKHPNGNITLGDIQKDIFIWNESNARDTYGFTSSTVQALIDKIIELQNK